MVMGWIWTGMVLLALGAAVLTGQTGAGKSTVSQRLAARGCAVIDCDAVTHDPALYSGECLAELQKAFGRDIIRPEGTLDRRLLARRAFADDESTQTLNRITHPVIFGRLRAEIAAKKAAGSGCASTTTTTTR